MCRTTAPGSTQDMAMDMDPRTGGIRATIRRQPQRALSPGAAARVEHLTELHDQALPLLVRQPAIEVDRSSHADRQAEDRAGGGAEAHAECQPRDRSPAGR